MVSPQVEQKRSEKGNEVSGKRERGINEDSSFHLNAPENAVVKSWFPCCWSMAQALSQWKKCVEPSDFRLRLQLPVLQPGVSRSDVKITTVKPYGMTGES
jgi:hypothetical protein